MADLITHTCVALLWKVATCPAVANPGGGGLAHAGPVALTPVGQSARAWPLPPTVATFVLGTCLPDLLGRVPAMILEVLSWHLPIPIWAIYFWTVFHIPVGVLVGGVVAAQAWREGARLSAFRQLVGGGLLHILVDLFQSHMGTGYVLLFPFSMWDYEIGWIGSEDTVRIVPVLLPLTLGLCWARWRSTPPADAAPPAPRAPEG